jgi:hypothetical protein
MHNPPIPSGRATIVDRAQDDVYQKESNRKVEAFL